MRDLVEEKLPNRPQTDPGVAVQPGGCHKPQTGPDERPKLWVVGGGENPHFYISKLPINRPLAALLVVIVVVGVVVGSVLSHDGY